MASEVRTRKETSKNPARGMAALYVTWAILTSLRAMRWTIRRLVLALALPLAVGGAFEMWLGRAAALVAVVLAALLVGWIAIGYTVREAAAQQRAAASGLQWLQALAQVSLSLSQGLDRNRLLRQITEALATLTSAHNVVLWELDAASSWLVRRAWTTDPSIGAMELPSSLTLQQGGAGWIARHREALFVDDIAQDARIMAADWALSRDLVAFAGAPVAAGDELLGVLTLNLKRGRLPEGNDRALLLSFASQAAVAMRNARLFADNTRLYEEAQQRVRELQETQAQLVQAAKLSAVGQLVSGVAHELNNPLSVVIGYGQLLLARGVPDEARRPIELMIAHGGRGGARPWVVAQVADNGPGTPAELPPRIFEPFFPTKKVGEGAGRGLRVSDGMAEEPGGRLSVERRLGRSVFTLELPAAAPV